MPKKVKELSALAVKNITRTGLHAVGGVDGLYLSVGKAGNRNWILRARINYKRTDIGLGSYTNISLQEARNKARLIHEEISKGVDVVKARKDAKIAAVAERALQTPFKECATEFIDKKAVEWKNKKLKKLWTATLEKYAYPVIGTISMDKIQLSHILAILEPIWEDKTETAQRVRSRIENIIDWDMVKKQRVANNPARWKGYLDKILPNPGLFKQVNHHRALPIHELPSFLTELAKVGGMGARALEFLILTAARSGEVRGMIWSEVDFENKTWTIPPERMKARKKHKVPLSNKAIQLLRNLKRDDDVIYVFPNALGGMLSDMAISATTKRMKVNAVPHGFRSTFRDWVAEFTDYSGEVAEMALAHAVKNKVEAAYRRGDLFEKRKLLMNDWQDFCYSIKKVSIAA